MQSFKNFTSSSEIVHFGKVADSSPATSVDLSACEKFRAHYSIPEVVLGLPWHVQNKLSRKFEL